MWQLILTSILLGVGLAMDACAVSMTNGLNEPKMKRGKAIAIAFTFAFFQALMPMIGWICVTLITDAFTAFANWIPFIAFALLLIIGIKMLVDGIKHLRANKAASKEALTDTSTETTTAPSKAKPLTVAALLIQAVATSIDALSTGFSLADIAENIWWKALLSAGIIAVITFAISIAGVLVGKKFGDKLGAKAEILGGCVLILIGIELLIKGILNFV